MAATRKRPVTRSGRTSPQGAERALQNSIEPIYVAAGAAIAECRHRVRLTQEQLAERSDLSQNQVARIERGMRRVSLAQLDRLARAMGASLLDLLPVKDAAGAVRLPSSVIAAWGTLSAEDRRLAAGLLDRLAGK